MMRKFAARYSAYMLRSNSISKFACVLVILSAFYQFTYSLEIIGPAKAVDLESAVLRTVVLELGLLISFLLRLIALWKRQFISLWIVAGSWLLCSALGSAYVFTVYDGIPAMDDIFRIDILANWTWAFIIFSVPRFLITAAMAYAVSLDEFNPYS